MSIKHGEETTIKELLEGFDNDSVKWAKTLYKNNCVNWRGKPTDSERPYSEVIAEKLLESCYLAALKNIEVVKRSEPYALKHEYKINPDSNRKEEKFAIRLAKAHNEPENSDIKVECDFCVMGYQIPLKGGQSDRGVGKIDLVATAKDSSKKEVYLLELKKDSSTETLLRCILEIYTYWCQLDHEKFIKNFVKKLETNQGLTIIPAILIFKGSLPHNEYEELNEGNRPNLAKLIGALEKNMRERQPEYSNPRFKFFEISKVGETYEINECTRKW
ncbi:MAG: hypothetical protein IKW49_00255 [Opitutales bacterium]|nr:hypothetical protein [Opitutales bacterium]